MAEKPLYLAPLSISFALGARVP
ncbi:hypothetical protein MPLDJ20_150012 [Mesorhizobium plurifarium]|uniref:Uncharacterized protein n=1 Tax=Mesorhizobium plurifarium TaxID=69974 RepID=A0A090ESK6_MESPL|nr:hypothetical protein MPLDJ20_150012 [Mesorhizobium plurifarium]